jgi:hypothetical protein
VLLEGLDQVLQRGVNLLGHGLIVAYEGKRASGGCGWPDPVRAAGT